MKLPGGISAGGTRLRDFAFRPLTGAVELALAEAASTDCSLPARVTAALKASLESVGGSAPLPDVVAGLSVADRQFLMLELAARLGPAEIWLTACCAGCGESFDFAVDYRKLPVKEAGEGYPFVDVETGLGTCRFRAPTGADQERIADLGDDQAVRCLLACCMVADERSSRNIADSFNAEDMGRIETALEAMAPEVAVAVQATCPACGMLHVIEVDPYRALSPARREDLLQEIHVIACAYHWGEAEILELPLARHRRYLDLIDRGRGMAG